MDLISLNFFIFIYVIHGLLRTFAERVQIIIKEKYNGVVSYDFLTYEELINFVNQEVYLSARLSKLMLRSRKILEPQRKNQDFLCGYEKILPPSIKKENIIGQNIENQNQTENTQNIEEKKNKIIKDQNLKNIQRKYTKEK